MKNLIEYRVAENSDMSFIEMLLKENELPFLDLNISKVFLMVAVAVKDAEIIGCIGIEIYKNDALLRSFAVGNEYKNKGVGRKLYNKLIEKLKAENIKILHLLTTTADMYFYKKGFRKSKREFAPATIKQTREFSDLCPSNSIYMTLKL